jgi:catechol 2,3-dioxygenase-like lactoylglutathione lyase family enzyme
MPSLNAPVPVLRIFDEAKAREFYVDFLGFTVDWEHRFEADLPVYLQVSREACVLHLSAHFGDGTPGSCVFLPMQGVREYQAWLLAKKYPHARPGVCDQPWGWTEIHLVDPFGNQLRFAEKMPSAD